MTGRSLVLALALTAAAAGGCKADGPAPVEVVPGQRAGVVIDVSGAVTATRAGQPPRALATGDEVAGDDDIHTGADGTVLIELVHNRATFSLPAGRTQRVSASLAWNQAMAAARPASTDEHSAAAGRPVERSAVGTSASSADKGGAVAERDRAAPAATRPEVKSTEAAAPARAIAAMDDPSPAPGAANTDVAAAAAAELTAAGEGADDTRAASGKIAAERVQRQAPRAAAPSPLPPAKTTGAPLPPAKTTGAPLPPAKTTGAPPPTQTPPPPPTSAAPSGGAPPQRDEVHPRLPRILDITVSGPLTTVEVSAPLRKVEAWRCWGPDDDAAKLLVYVQPDGAISRVGAPDSPALATCAKRALRRLTFPARGKRSVITIVPRAGGDGR